MNANDLSQLLETLRAEGDDSEAVEAKRASGGWPEDIAKTLSAFSNTPGGGTILFGVDESSGFEAVGVYNSAACRKALATTCRNALDPPITHRCDAVRTDGRVVLIAEIPEADAGAKPVRVKTTGKAFLRSHDGDFQLSPVEEQAFIANRSAPHHDGRPAEGASQADLDDELVGGYLNSCRSASTSLARFDDSELLFRTGVLVGDEKQPSVAGLLALGRHPQQFFPNFVIQAHATPGLEDPTGTRAVDARRFDGPVPMMLRESLVWIRRNSGSRVVFGEDGHGRDEPEYPAEAVRELVANALVHRDLGPHAEARPISMILESGRLVLSNPGGLYGISRDALGRTGTTSTRNGLLVRICQNTRFDGDLRVCEALASGIPTVLAAVRRAQMKPPAFFDQGIGFTVAMPNHALLAREELDWLGSLGDRAAGLTDAQRHALVMLRRGSTFTNRSFRTEFPMDSQEARRELAGLVDRDLARAEGERGSRTYHLAIPSSSSSAGNGVRERIKAELKSRPQTIAELVEATGFTTRQVSYALRVLRDSDDVRILEGGPGQRTIYGLLGSLF